MPELPEVETVRRGLLPVLEGAVLHDVMVHRRDLRRPIPEDLEDRTRGKTIIRLDRRSKYLLFTLDTQDVIVIHLGMSGRMRIETGNPPPRDKHDHVEFVTAHHQWVRFGDPRRFGFIDLLSPKDIATYDPFTRLGRDPFDPTLKADDLYQQAQRRRISLKAFLMDQSILAGLGNIYVNEVLFRSRLDPRRPANQLTYHDCARLLPEIQTVLREAIDAGGSSLKDHRQANGELGYFQHSFQVYGREDTLCPACEKTPIRRIVQQNRATFFCSNCQT